MKIRAAAKIVVCLKVPPEKTKSGIMIPEDEKARSELGIVHVIGPGKKPLAFEVGDKIAYRKYTDNKINIAGDEYNFIEFKDIVARIDK